MNSLADLLDAVASFLKRFVVFQSDAQAVAVTLWIAHTHVIEAADQTPYLLVSSPEKRSGKSRLIEVVYLLAARPWNVIRPSEPVLFRKIASDSPTLLLDEIDAIFGKGNEHEGIRSVLNAGYRRGVTVSRCVGEGKTMRIEEFPVFGPKLLAGIGWPPDTVLDRGIPIQLQRKSMSEPVEGFRRRDVEPDAVDLRNALSEALQPHIQALTDARPELQPQLNDRAMDGWEPLFAIAELAGREWRARARSASVELHLGNVADDESTGVLLLGHFRDLLGDDERITTQDLLRGLIENEDGPWASWWARDVEDAKTKGPAARLARILRPFGIKSKTIKLEDGTTAKGFLRDTLEDAFTRYLPPLLVKSRNDVTVQVNATLNGNGLGPEKASDQGRYEVTTSSRNQGGGAERPPDFSFF